MTYDDARAAVIEIRSENAAQITELFHVRRGGGERSQESTSEDETYFNCARQRCPLNIHSGNPTERRAKSKRNSRCQLIACEQPDRNYATPCP
jgi:hypothetical protein